MEKSAKTAIITGATSGIGLETAMALAHLKFKLVLPVRNIDKGRALKEKIHEFTGNGMVDLFQCDLSSLESVREFAEMVNNNYDRLDVLINNAGVWEMKRKESKDGIELTWAVNHLSPFLMTNLLLDKLKASAPSRIITVSSMAHKAARINFDDLEARRGWSWINSYSQSKLANVLFTRHLAKYLKGSGVVANCLHPGVVSTNLFNKMPAILHWPMKQIMITPDRGAETIVYLASAAEAEQVSGEYFSKKKVVKTSNYARDPKIAEKLWKISLQYTGL